MVTGTNREKEGGREERSSKISRRHCYRQQAASRLDLALYLGKVLRFSTYTNVISSHAYSSWIAAGVNGPLLLLRMLSGPCFNMAGSGMDDREMAGALRGRHNRQTDRQADRQAGGKDTNTEKQAHQPFPGVVCSSPAGSRLVLVQAGASVCRQASKDRQAGNPTQHGCIESKSVFLLSGPRLG